MCMIDGCDEYDRANVERVCKARKQHKCDECYRLIEAGEPYLRCSGIESEGTPFVWKVCQHCKVGTDWLRVNCGGWLRGGGFVAEDLREHADEYRRPDLLRHVVGANRKWQRKRGHAGLRPVPHLPRPLKLGDARV